MKLKDTTASWANNASAGTAVAVDFAPSSFDHAGRDVLVTVRNPSSVTALAVTVQNRWTDPADASGATVRYAKLTSFTAAVTATNADGESFVVTGAMVTGAGRVSLSNVTALGASDAFAASVQITEVE